MFKEREIKNHTAVFMIVVAGFFDALQWLLTFLFMGWLVSIFTFLTFYVWFKTYGMSFMTPKRFMVMGGGFIFELIPGLNVIPAWTAVVSYMIFSAKAEKVVPGASKIINIASKGKVRIPQKKSVQHVEEEFRDAA